MGTVTTPNELRVRYYFIEISKGDELLNKSVNTTVVSGAATMWCCCAVFNGSSSRLSAGYDELQCSFNDALISHPPAAVAAAAAVAEATLDRVSAASIRRLQWQVETSVYWLMVWRRTCVRSQSFLLYRVPTAANNTRSRSLPCFEA